MPAFALKILIVEDNDDLLQGWLSFFQSRGHYVRGLAMAEELLYEYVGFTPDIYVIDLNLPDADGLDLVKKIRMIHPKVGIVITTARSQIGDKVVGYESGADIYFTKPVAPDELMAGIAALAKKSRPDADPAKVLQLRLANRALDGPEGSVDLSPNELILLTALVRASGQPLARWQLAELMGSGEVLPSAATIEMRIARLRKKLTAAGGATPSIQAVYGRGYLLTCTVLLD